MDVTNLTAETEDFTGNVWKLSNGETVLVDVGTGDAWHRISGLETVDKVVITHSHHDHVDSLPKVLDRFDPELYAYEPDNLPVKAEEIDEGDKVDLCGVPFEVFHTPGHKNDSICLYSRKKKVLFTGDLIFPEGGFGRTDLDEGDRDLLIESMEKVADLRVEAFYPGHESRVEEDAPKWIRRSLENARRREPKY